MSDRPEAKGAARPGTVSRRGAPNAGGSRPAGGLWSALGALALGELRHTLSQPRLLVFLFLLPIVFSSVLALFQSSEVGPLRIIISRPDTPLAAQFAAEVKRSGVQLETADARAANIVARNERELWVRLPKDFDRRLSAGERVQLDVVLSPSNLRVQSALAALRAAAARLDARFAAREAVRDQRPDASRALLDDAANRVTGLLSTPAVTLDVQTASPRRTSSTVTPTGSSQTTPGMTLMFALLFGAQTGITLLRDRASGTLARLYAAPLPRVMVMLGKLLGNAGVLVVQLAVMIAFGALALGVRWGNIGVLAVPAVAFALCASAFGAFCAAVTRTPSQLSAFSILLVNVTSALGGMWWPLEVTPAWMQKLALALPTYWAMDAFQDVMLRGAGVVAVLPHSLLLVGFAALFLWVGARAFRFE